MINKLINLIRTANHLDNMGYHKKASELDQKIFKLASKINSADDTEKAEAEYKKDLENLEKKVKILKESIETHRRHDRGYANELAEELETTYDEIGKIIDKLKK